MAYKQFGWRACFQNDEIKTDNAKTLGVRQLNLVYLTIETTSRQSRIWYLSESPNLPPPIPTSHPRTVSNLLYGSASTLSPIRAASEDLPLPHRHPECHQLFAELPTDAQCMDNGREDARPTPPTYTQALHQQRLPLARRRLVVMGHRLEICTEISWYVILRCEDMARTDDLTSRWRCQR